MRDMGMVRKRSKTPLSMSSRRSTPALWLVVRAFMMMSPGTIVGR